MGKKQDAAVSRLGKKPIKVPGGVDVSLREGVVHAKGPNGTLQRALPQTTDLQVVDGEVLVTSQGGHPNAKAFHGLARSLVQNLVTGVSEGFTKELQLEGVGYRAKVEGKNLVLSLGYSHPVEMPIPEGLKVEVGGKKQEEVKITGADNELLGEWVAKVRRKRPPEPYKGKGIRYKGERIKLKAGKRVGA